MCNNKNMHHSITKIVLDCQPLEQLTSCCKAMLCEIGVCYLVYESVGQMEEGHYSTPANAINEDVPSHLHEDFLSTISLKLVDQSEE